MSKPLSLVEQVRRSRQRRVDVNGRTIIVRRPTDLEMTEFRGLLGTRDVLERFIVGWEGFTEGDLVRAGSDEEIGFNTDLFMEYAEDHAEIWPILVKEVVASYKEHEAATAESLKN